MQAAISTPAAHVSYPALPSTEVSTGPNGWGYRLAGLVLFVSILFTGADPLYGQTMPAISAILINLWVSIGLLFKNKHARWAALARAAIGVLIWPIFFFIANDPLTTILLIVVNGGFYVPVLLLLTGQSKVWRLVSGMGIFLVFGLGLYGLLLSLTLFAPYVLY
ncbi:MAG: hypothetical protein Fur0044_28180 [Anaerolineae bacterium]|nr:hypothetical protein [Anaerolineales bacterium]MCQ3979390.1 hypothetical protein [Anaerolineae bacterium]